jgi:hypothetical protein
MHITVAVHSDVDEAVQVLVAAFAEDPITAFLLTTAPRYPDRLARFFSILMRVRITLDMPVLLASGSGCIKGGRRGLYNRTPKMAEGPHRVGGVE